MVFALMNHPRMPPNITRMTIRMTPDDPTFIAHRELSLRNIGPRLEEAARRKPVARAAIDLMQSPSRAACFRSPTP